MLISEIKWNRPSLSSFKCHNWISTKISIRLLAIADKIETSKSDTSIFLCLFECKVEKEFHKSALLVLLLFLNVLETRCDVILWWTSCWCWICFMTPFFRPDKWEEFHRKCSFYLAIEPEQEVLCSCLVGAVKTVSVNQVKQLSFITFD